MMVHFTEIRPTIHYILRHAKDVPWEKVVEIILTTKNPRRRADKYRIEQKGYYVLFRIEGGILSVINAKKKGRK